MKIELNKCYIETNNANIYEIHLFDKEDKDFIYGTKYIFFLTTISIENTIRSKKNPLSILFNPTKSQKQIIITDIFTKEFGRN